MKIKLYNRYCQEVSGIRQLFSEEFGTGELDDRGEPIVNWEKFSINSDDDGFDLDVGVQEDIILPVGTVLIRYGNERGYCLAPEGTPYEELALPWKMESVEFHMYEVQEEMKWRRGIRKGIVAKNFLLPGGAVQFIVGKGSNKVSVRDLIQSAQLKEVFEWRKRE